MNVIYCTVLLVYFWAQSSKMKLELDDKMSIGLIQDLFHCLFPFLKIQFFEKGIRMQARNALRKHIGDGSRLLGSFKQGTDNEQSSMWIEPGMTVSELENSFNNSYSLHTQVYRKSGNVWLEATVTDSWTLEEQNRQGEMLADRVR